jgi:hypothetical protein
MKMKGHRSAPPTTANTTPPPPNLRLDSCAKRLLDVCLNASSIRKRESESGRCTTVGKDLPAPTIYGGLSGTVHAADADNSQGAAPVGSGANRCTNLPVSYDRADRSTAFMVMMMVVMMQ